MAVDVRHADSRIVWASFSAYLGEELTVLRATSDSTQCKVMCGFGLVGIALLSVIETLVRGVLSILGLPIAYSLDNRHVKQVLIMTTAGGALMSIGAAICCFNAFIANFESRNGSQIKFKECMPECVRRHLEAMSNAL